MAGARETQQDPQPDKRAGVEQVDDLLPKRNEPEQPPNLQHNRMANSENPRAGTDATAPL